MQAEREAEHRAHIVQLGAQLAQERARNQELQRAAAEREQDILSASQLAEQQLLDLEKQLCAAHNMLLLTERGVLDREAKLMRRMEEQAGQLRVAEDLLEDKAAVQAAHVHESAVVRSEIGVLVRALAGCRDTVLRAEIETRADGDAWRDRQLQAEKKMTEEQLAMDAERRSLQRMEAERQANRRMEAKAWREKELRLEEERDAARTAAEVEASGRRRAQDSFQFWARRLLRTTSASIPADRRQRPGGSMASPEPGAVSSPETGSGAGASASSTHAGSSPIVESGALDDWSSGLAEALETQMEVLCGALEDTVQETRRASVEIAKVQQERLREQREHIAEQQERVRLGDLLDQEKLRAVDAIRRAVAEAEEALRAQLHEATEHAAAAVAEAQQALSAEAALQEELKNVRNVVAEDKLASTAMNAKVAAQTAVLLEGVLLAQEAAQFLEASVHADDFTECEGGTDARDACRNAGVQPDDEDAASAGLLFEVQVAQLQVRVSTRCRCLSFDRL